MKLQWKRKLAILLTFVLACSLVGPVNLQVRAAAGDAAVFAVDLKDIAIQNVTQFQYSNAEITSKNGSDKVTSLTVMVSKGDIYTVDGAITDKSQTIATWVWNDGTTVDAVQSKLRSIVFDYEAGMQVTVIVDGNKMNLPTVSGITSYTLGQIPQGSTEIGNSIHYYMYIEYPTEDKDVWDVAYGKAKTYYFMGMRGYLVTITEANEDKVLDEITDQGAWAGGAKISKNMNASQLDGDTFMNETAFQQLAPADSAWTWVCGPEAGIRINVSGSYANTKYGIDGATEGYANWRRPAEDPENQEPNDYRKENSNGEWWLQVHFPDATHGWNDLNSTTMQSNEGGVYLSGAFVEFSEYDNGMDPNYDKNKKITVVNEPSHQHKWNVERSGSNATISAYCTETFDNGDCTVFGPGHSKTIRLAATNDVYTGAPYVNATITGSDEVMGLLNEGYEEGEGWSLQTTYKGRNGTQYTESEVAPTNVGNYVVTVTLTSPDATQTYSVSKNFMINKTNLTVTPKDATVVAGGTISSTPADVVADGLKGEDTITAANLYITTNINQTTNATPLYVNGVVIKNGDEDVTANYTIRYNDGRLKIVDAIHDWIVEENEEIPGALDIYCQAESAMDPGCTHKEDATSTIQVVATDTTYTGVPYTGATIEDEDAILAVVNEKLQPSEKWTSTITYEGREGTVYPENAIPPTKAGTYYAVMTVTNPSNPDGTYVVKTPFEIAKQEVTITPKDQELGKGAVVSSTVDDVIVSGLVNGDTLTAVTVEGDTSTLTDNGTLSVDEDSIVIKNGSIDVTDNYSIYTNYGDLTVVPARHDWEVHVDAFDSTIWDVYCDNGDPSDDPGCSWVGMANAVQIKTTAPNTTYTGEPYTGAEVDDGGILDVINEDLPDQEKWTIAVTYEGRNGTDYPESSTAPTDAGTYYAVVTLTDSDGVARKIRKPFEIAKKVITVTPKKQCVEKGESVASGVEYVEVTGLAEEDTIVAATITGNTSVITKEGTLTVDPRSIVIKNGDKDVTNNYNVQVQNGTLVVPAKHEWIVETDSDNPDAVIIYCNNGNRATDPGCAYVGPENAEAIQLDAPNASYTGEPYTGADVLNTDLLEEINDNLPDEDKWTISEVSYEGQEGTDYPESSTAPTDAGAYNAIVTIKDTEGNEYQMVAPFEIEKQRVTITAKNQLVGIDGQVSSTVEDVTIAGLRDGDQMDSVIIRGDTSHVTDYGRVQIIDVVIKNGDKDVTRNYDITTTDGVLKVIDPQHEWKAEVNPNNSGAVDIYCASEDETTDPGCPNAGKENAKEIALVADNATYTGEPYAGVALSGGEILDKVNEDLPEDKKWTISNETYVGRDGTSYPETTTPPTNAGKYNAIVTITNSDGEEIKLVTPFEIEKCKLTIVAKDQTVTDGGAVSSLPKDVTVTGLVNGDAIIAITIQTNDAKDKVVASAVVIKNGNVDVTSNYDVVYTTGKLTNNQTVKNSVVKPADNTVATTEDKTVIKKPSAEEVYVNETAINAGLKVMQTKKQINVKWGKVPGANRYEVFIQYCGKKFKTKPTKVVDNEVTTSVKVTKINGKKLNLKKNYKIYVVAYKVSGSQKVKLGETIRAHIVGVKNTTQTNVKCVKVKKSKYTLSVGKTAKIKAWTVLVDKTKHQLSNAHAKALRYRTDNEKVATVSSKGKIKAVGKGTCTIYVYARNGYAKKVKVTVK